MKQLAKGCPDITQLTWDTDSRVHVIKTQGNTASPKMSKTWAVPLKVYFFKENCKQVFRTCLSQV